MQVVVGVVVTGMGVIVARRVVRMGMVVRHGQAPRARVVQRPPSAASSKSPAGIVTGRSM